MNFLLGGTRFAHQRRLQDDRAVAQIFGLERGRINGEDAFRRLTEKLEKEEMRHWMSKGEEFIYYAELGKGQSLERVRAWKGSELGKGQAFLLFFIVWAFLLFIDRQEPRAVKKRPKPFSFLTESRHIFKEVAHRGSHRSLA